uniref:Uncharacterized protein n=1 Tax=Timema tahoe TaxID=61484 RepID=A0A7R9IID6_9NEOP|nr:unnamed protein product [Timema tahoe]
MGVPQRSVLVPLLFSMFDSRAQECYGSKDPAKISQVKELYDALGLPVTYKQYEEQTYDLLCTQIQQISRGLPHKLFFRFLDNVYVKNVTNEIN